MFDREPEVLILTDAKSYNKAVAFAFAIALLIGTVVKIDEYANKLWTSYRVQRSIENSKSNIIEVKVMPFITDPDLGLWGTKKRVKLKNMSDINISNVGIKALFYGSKNKLLYSKEFSIGLESKKILDYDIDLFGDFPNYRLTQKLDLVIESLEIEGIDYKDYFSIRVTK